MEAPTSLKQKIENLFKSDPKPIFDHFRNIAIAATLALGASALQSFNLDNNPLYVNNIALACSYVTFAIAIFLLIINISFAQISINMFFFNKTKFDGAFQKIGSAIVLYTYTGVLLALTVMYTLNTSNDKIEKLDQQKVESEKLYLNIMKIEEALEKLGKENSNLRSENSRLKDEIDKLNSQSSQYNNSIEP
jgi:cell division protein ZapA (FtsZ GTPase activity inhibitor)